VFGIRISNPGDAAFALRLGEAFGNGQNLSLDSISFDIEDSRHLCTHWSLIQGGIVSGRIAPAVMIFPSHSSLFFRVNFADYAADADGPSTLPPGFYLIRAKLHSVPVTAKTLTPDQLFLSALDYWAGDLSSGVSRFFMK